MKKIATTISTFAVMSIAATSTVLAQRYDYDYYYDGAVADSFVAGFSFIWLCVCCLGIVILGGIAFFMYKDAKKNNVENPALWGLLGLTGLLGLLIYFIAVRPEAIRKNSGLPSSTTSTTPVETKEETKSE